MVRSAARGYGGDAEPELGLHWSRVGSMFTRPTRSLEALLTAKCLIDITDRRLGYLPRSKSTREACGWAARCIGAAYSTGPVGD